MWYVIQTSTGREEELLSFIPTVLSQNWYRQCFIPRAEWMKRLGGEWRVQIRPLFPGYLFIETDEPERLYYELKAVPRFTKILGSETCEFIPVKSEEQEVFCRLWNREEDYIVRLSSVHVAEDGTPVRLGGVLREFKDNILRIYLHKRYALIRLALAEQEKVVSLGIRLK